MKKVITVLSIITILFPNCVLAQEKTCTKEKIEQLKEQIKDITFELEYIPKGTQLKDVMGDKYTIEENNLFKVTSPKMPENFTSEFYENSSVSHIVSSVEYSYLSGGVYEVKISSEDCGTDIIKMFQIMLPYYNPDNKKSDAWFDGTYSQIQSNKNADDKGNVIDSRLLLTLVTLVIIIFASLFLLKRRRIK